jgi:hypothetical protein
MNKIGILAAAGLLIAASAAPALAQSSRCSLLYNDAECARAKEGMPRATGGVPGEPDRERPRTVVIQSPPPSNNSLLK